MSENKPREWWIFLEAYDPYTQQVFENEEPNGTHVIEKTAYDVMKTERDEAIRALEIWKMSVPSYDTLSAENQKLRVTLNNAAKYLTDCFEAVQAPEPYMVEEIVDLLVGKK